MKEPYKSLNFGVWFQHPDVLDHCKRIIRLINLPLDNLQPHQYVRFVTEISKYIFDTTLTMKERVSLVPLAEYENPLNLPYDDDCRKVVPVLDIGMAAWLEANNWKRVCCFDINKARQAQNVGHDRGRDFYSDRYMRDVCTAVLEVLDKKAGQYLITRHIADQFTIWVDPSTAIRFSSYRIIEQIRDYFEQKPVVALFAKDGRNTLNLAGIKEIEYPSITMLDQYWEVYDLNHRKFILEKLRPNLAALLALAAEQHQEQVLSFIETVGYESFELLFLCDKDYASQFINRPFRLYRNICDFAEKLRLSDVGDYALIKIALPGFWKHLADHCSHNEIVKASQIFFKTLMQILLSSSNAQKVYVLDIIGDTYVAIPEISGIDRVLDEIHYAISGYYPIDCGHSKLRLPLIPGIGSVMFSLDKNDNLLKRLDTFLKKVDILAQEEHRRCLLSRYCLAEPSEQDAWQFLIYYLSPYTARGRERLKELKLNDDNIKTLQTYYDSESGDFLIEHYLVYVKSIKKYFAQYFNKNASCLICNGQR